MRVRYTLLDPTKNYTLLVESPVPPEERQALAARLMERESAAEQAGFLLPGDGGVCLAMAGGEFCGNAALCAAVLHAERQGTGRARLPVRFSGAEVTVEAEVQKAGDGAWTGTVAMPRPVSLRRETLPGGRTLPVVILPGIAHVVTEEPMERAEAEALASLWCGFLRADALGVLAFDRRENRLTPLVYVPAAGTLCWENACASGAAALGYCLWAERRAPFEMEIAQPGGALRIALDAAGALRLTGRVEILRRREMEL